ncbi:hypothetical protein ABLO27_06255 [Roseibium sp. SCPC15]|uniref:hypothetical protein n=1 Tax=Roseibium sp. SCP15 TaxID=3141376 RepID=UPI00333BEF07
MRKSSRPEIVLLFFSNAASVTDQKGNDKTCFRRVSQCRLDLRTDSASQAL